VLRFDDIVRLHRVDRVELRAWIEQRWVRPQEAGGETLFDAVDAARVMLIRDLQRDLLPDPDALGLVLSLLDQLYATRRVLHSIEDAIAALPEDMRAEVVERLRRPPDAPR